MISKQATNSQRASLASRLAKKLVSVLPAGAPSKIYNAALKVPVARNILGKIVGSMIPENIKVNGYTLFLDQTDMAVSGSLALKGFEPSETEQFRSALRPGMNVVDIGAHIGYYSLLASKVVGDGGKVFAFEPEPHNYALLQKNIRTNKAPNITAINEAVSDTDGERVLFIEGYNKGHHSFGRDTGTIGEIKVKTETLDSVLMRYGNPIIDVVKIDIEGAEPIALRGMKETMTRSPNLVIFTEVYPKCMTKLGESAEDYLNALKRLGFELSIIDNKKVIFIKDVKDFIASMSGDSFRNITATRASFRHI